MKIDPETEISKIIDAFTFSFHSLYSKENKDCVNDGCMIYYYMFSR